MKKKKKMLIILLTVIIIILAIGVALYYVNKTDRDEKELIKATKNIENEYEKKEVCYGIEMKDYEVLNIQKEITFDTEEQAQLEYERYQIINKYERKNLNVQIKKKKLTILMTEDQFREDVEYDESKNIRLIDSTGEQKEIMDQEEIINALVKQGYTIK